MNKIIQWFNCKFLDKHEWITRGYYRPGVGFVNLTYSKHCYKKKQEKR